MAAKTDKFEIELVGAGPLLARIDAAIAMLDNPYELLDAIGAELETNIGLRHTTFKVDASGASWAPLAESTKKRYDRKYKGSIPGSLLDRHTPGMASTLTHNTTNDSVEVGYSAAYAIYHVTGTKHMPRRDPIFGFVNDDGTQGEMGDEDQADVLAVVESFLNEALGG